MWRYSSRSSGRSSGTEREKGQLTCAMASTVVKNTPGLHQQSVHAPTVGIHKYGSWCWQNQQQWSQRLVPVRVTNEGKEVLVKKIVEQRGLESEEYMMVEPKNPVPNPELGPLERQVSVTFEEGLAQEEVDREAMEYWFTEPAQGWATEKVKLKKAPTLGVDENFDDFRHGSDDVDGRVPLSSFEKGHVLVGRVVEHLLHHGLRVDVNGVADGLVPIKDIEMWKKLQEKSLVPEIGETMEVEVHAVRDDPVFRFPLQLAPTSQAICSIIDPPEAHQPPLDLRDVPLSRYDEIAKLSGRDWGTQKVLVTPAGMDDQEAMSPLEDDIELTDEDLKLFDEIFAELDL